MIKKFKHIRQPKDSLLCGQACLAMITKQSLEESIKHIGHSHGTITKELVKVLKKFKYKTPKKLLRLSYIPKYAIAKIPHKNIKGYPKNARGWHWVVYWNGKRYDPDWNSPSFCYNVKASSFLPILNLK